MNRYSTTLPETENLSTEEESVSRIKDIERARSVAGWSTTIDTLDELGIEFHSVLERVDQSASCRYIAKIHAASAQHFSDLLSEKMQEVLRHWLKQGLFPHKASLGYRNLVTGRDERPPSGVNIIPDPENVPLIVRSFSAVAAGLRLMEDVRKEVNALGLRSASDVRFPDKAFTTCCAMSFVPAGLSVVSSA